MAKAKKKANAETSERISPWFLEHVKLTSFGRFANVFVGPLGPGLNVVLGPNEAGKTTLSELIKGIIFGWPAARGGANPYRPQNAERSGSLFFRNESTDDVQELTRVRNPDGIDDESGVTADIDRETYDVMFALTSDELLGLDRHNEVTARLLTAGSGTSLSPAHALTAVREQMSELLSHSGLHPNSICNLQARQTELRATIRAGAEEADRLRVQEQTLAALQPRRETLKRAQDGLNDRIETLSAAAARLESLDAERKKVSAAREQAASGITAAQRTTAAAPTADIAAIASLPESEALRINDRIDDLAEQRAKLLHAVDNARRDATKSRADWEVQREEASGSEGEARNRRQRQVRLAFVIAVPLFMALLGAYLMYHARTDGGMSHFLIGVAIIVFSLVIIAAGVSLSLRPSREEEEVASEERKRSWVMRQDAAALAACERDLSEFDEHTALFFGDIGLGAAGASLRRARRLMEDAQAYRRACEQAQHNAHALELQRAALDEQLEHLERDRNDLFGSVGLEADASPEDLQRAIDRASDERARTSELARETDRQIGEITQQLATARHLTSFDSAKMEEETVKTRLKEANVRLATLLVAEQSLEQAIAEWEKKSQPAVYAHASRLFSQMTGGAWEQVRMNASGNIEVVDAVRTVRAPQLLSLGTRQQLYLALRIALLMAADNVGRALPILCDDILVNFDDVRRAQAARALAELARRRQVILFTCHPDVADAVCAADASAVRLEL